MPGATRTCTMDDSKSKPLDSWAKQLVLESFTDVTVASPR